MATDVLASTKAFISGGAANTFPNKFIAQSIRQITSSSSLPVPVSMTTSHVSITPASPAAAPVSNDYGTGFATDAYRDGGGPDELVNPRTVGEPDDAEASITLTVGSDQLISAYSRFFLQSVSESDQEKFQIVETFTAYYAFFYGRRPPVYRYSGVLLNDENFRWANDMKFIYDNFFRGTKAVEYGAEVIMEYDGRLITGFPISMNMQQDAINTKGIPFSMDILVLSHTPLNFSKDIEDLISKAAQTLASSREKTKQALAAMNTGAPKSSVAQVRYALNGKMPTKSVKVKGVADNSYTPISNISNTA